MTSTVFSSPSLAWAPRTLPPVITPPPRRRLYARTWAQPENCVSEFTLSDTACVALSTRVDGCVSLLKADEQLPRTENRPFADCFCRQELLSDLVVCQGVHRECALDFIFDLEFDRYRQQWADYCTAMSPGLSVTTPLLRNITLAPASNTCAYVSTACDRYHRYREVCSTRHGDNFINCGCQSQIQYVESICTIDGQAFCPSVVGAPVSLEDLWAYQSCKTWLGITGSWDDEGFSYRRDEGETPTVTGNVPFADFPLTYFDVPTDPGVTHTFDGLGSRPRTGRLHFALCMLAIVLAHSA